MIAFCKRTLCLKNSFIPIFFISFIITVLIYHNILNYGFDYDDYHQIRPYMITQVIHSFYGTWDSTGIERDFYRPLSVTFYAIRFELLKYNTFLYHLLSIVMFAIVSSLLFRILYLYTYNLWFSLLGIIIFASHPYMAHSAIAWSSSQVQLLNMMYFLFAWIWIIYAKNKPMSWMYLLFIIQILAFLLKEDGLLLLPTLFLLKTSEKKKM